MPVMNTRIIQGEGASFNEAPPLFKVDAGTGAISISDHLESGTVSLGSYLKTVTGSDGNYPRWSQCDGHEVDRQWDIFAKHVSSSRLPEGIRWDLDENVRYKGTWIFGAVKDALLGKSTFIQTTMFRPDAVPLLLAERVRTGKPVEVYSIGTTAELTAALNGQDPMWRLLFTDNANRDYTYTFRDILEKDNLFVREKAFQAHRNALTLYRLNGHSLEGLPPWLRRAIRVTLWTKADKHDKHIVYKYLWDLTKEEVVADLTRAGPKVEARLKALLPELKNEESAYWDRARYPETMPLVDNSSSTRWLAQEGVRLVRTPEPRKVSNGTLIKGMANVTLWPPRWFQLGRYNRSTALHEVTAALEALSADKPIVDLSKKQVRVSKRHLLPAYDEPVSRKEWLESRFAWGPTNWL